MPGFDGTGPMGMGSMTGGGRGFCTVPANGVWSRRYFGRGGGRGRRNWFYATGKLGWMRATQGLPAWGGVGTYPYVAPYKYPVNPWGAEITPAQEAQMLREQTKALQAEIDDINQRLKEIESAKTEEKE